MTFHTLDVKLHFPHVPACLCVDVSRVEYLTSTRRHFGLHYMLKNAVQREPPSIENTPRTLCSISNNEMQISIKRQIHHFKTLTRTVR